MNSIWATSRHGMQLAIYAHQEDIYPDASSTSRDIVTDEYYIELMHSHCDTMRYMTIEMGENAFVPYIEKIDTSVIASIMISPNYLIINKNI